MIMRRLTLDASFVFFALFLAKKGWRASGARRRDVKAALTMLARAVIGKERSPRAMVERGV
jgi:hypothetical protein